MSWPREKGDLNWVLAPLVSFLNTLGGWYWRTEVRRLGIPGVICLWTFFYYGLRRWWYVFLYGALFGSVFAGLTMPLTLIGDSIGGPDGHWFNWVWLWLAGAIEGSALLPLCFFTYEDDDHSEVIKEKVIKWLWGILILSVAVGLPVTLSNTIDWPVHKWCEIIKGLAQGGIAAWLIGQEKK